MFNFQGKQIMLNKSLHLIYTNGFQITNYWTYIKLTQYQEKYCFLCVSEFSFFCMAFLEMLPYSDVAVHCIVHICIVVYCIALYCSVLYWAQYSTLQYSTVQYSIVQCNTVQYSTVQYTEYSTMQYSTVQCNTVQ